MYVLKILIDLFLFNNKRLYMCFVDYKKAFDNVNRIQLWQKMIDYNINGKIFNVVHNMYNLAKSCVSLPDGSVSSMFQCEVGVRQGENLSPSLFSIYLSDLNTFLANKNYGLKQFQSLASEFLNDDRILIFLKLHVLLYADDTVLIAETPENLQKQLDTMSEYCEIWKLCINLKKTKIVIFSRGKVSKNLCGEMM